jgi:adenylate kinase
VPGVCDLDGATLEKRSDEDELTVKRRLATYRQQTEPLERYYWERGLLRDVDAEAPMGDVSARMLDAIADVT